MTALRRDTRSSRGDMPGHPRALLPRLRGCRNPRMLLQEDAQHLAPPPAPISVTTAPSLRSPYDWAPAAPALTRQRAFLMQIHQKRSGDSSTLGLGWKPSPSPGRGDGRPESRARSCRPAELLCSRETAKGQAKSQGPKCPRWDLEDARVSIGAAPRPCIWDGTREGGARLGSLQRDIP